MNTGYSVCRIYLLCAEDLEEGNCMLDSSGIYRKNLNTMNAKDLGDQ